MNKDNRVRQAAGMTWPVLTAVLLFSFSFEVTGQGVNLGSPPIWNYSRKVYKAGTQNWDATQGPDRQLYFANNDGVLRFDGTQWQTFPVANHTIVRSVAADTAGHVYAGAQSEVGFFAPGKDGVLGYTSLIGKLPPDQRTFEDVWDIVLHHGTVFFRTNRQVFAYRDSSMRLFHQMGDLVALFETPMGVLLQREGGELLLYNDTTFVPFKKLSGMDSGVTGAIPWQGDTLLLTTLKNGIFYLTPISSGAWHTGHDVLLKEKRIYTATVLRDGKMALGTSLDGLIVVDQQRRFFRHLTLHDGLQNNNILSAFCDLDGNLWLGLDNGIDCVVLDSRFSTISPDGDLQGTGYAAAVFNGHLYLGVSNGAYVAPWQTYFDPEVPSYFSQVSHSDGQVWGFSEVGNALLMGHHEGAFQLTDNSAERLSFEQGNWTYVPVNDHYLIAGTYTGLTLYEKQKGTWVQDRKINGINESCRIIVKDDDGTLWVSHPYRGLYQVKWKEEKKYDPDVRFFDQSGGLPSNLNNYVFRISGRAVFGTEKGVYRFDRQQSRFVPDSAFNQLLGGDHRIRYMKEDARGNIWYVSDQEVGKLEVRDFGVRKEVVVQVFPELQGKLVGGFESIYPVDDDNIIFGAEEGFMMYDAHEREEEVYQLPVLLSSIRVGRTQDSLLFGGYAGHGVEAGITSARELPPALNTLSFSFSSPEYKTPYLIQYRTWLEGLEKDWTPWTSDTRRDYTTLGPGSYVFHAQARRKDGAMSEVISYLFRIKPPWYKTAAAFVLYGFGILGFFAGFMMRQRYKFESEKARMAESHQEKEAKSIREVEQSRAALTEIQNEKLGVEIKYKNQELALTTMHLVQKAEILLSVQDALKQIQHKAVSPEVSREIQQVINMVNFDVKLDEDWEHFAHHFDQVHVDFLKTLRDRFPQLSTSDLKLCAYLRMNLSTKEIAPLLNISVRGVEGSRYRLRRKLHLPNDTNLADFILGLPPALSGQNGHPLNGHEEE